MKRNIIIAFLLTCWLLACAHQNSTPVPTITAPKQTAPVAPSAEKTAQRTVRTVEAIDGAASYANQVNDLDPAKKPLVSGLTNARAEAVAANVQAQETKVLAVAKDAEAKAAQGALVEAIKAVKDLAASEASARAERDKLQEQIDDHRNDWFGPATHRLVKGLFWTLIIGGGVLIGLGILGSLYGLPSITKPVFGSLGGLLDGARWVLYRVGTIIWSAIPLAGHAADEFLNKHGELSRAAKQEPSHAVNLNADANGPTSGAWVMQGVA